MLGSSDKDNLAEDGFLGALVYLVKMNPVRSLIYLGCIPFAVLWIVRDSLATAFALQAYFITAGVFVYVPFRTAKEEVKKKWFWKAMLQCGAVIHPVVLAFVWYLDVSYPSFVIGGATLFLLIFMASLVEIIVLKSLVERFRPRIVFEDGRVPR